MTPWKLRQAIKIIKSGGIIAYPTEAVFGLGCDPFNLDAVATICSLKKRGFEKGLILIVSSLDQARPYTSASNTQLKKLLQKTNRAVTWVLPASDRCPPWINGQHNSIAIRYTTHPVARQLCEQADQALVSTSANISRCPPARHARDVLRIFGNRINIILHDDTGNHKNPSEIRDLTSGKKLR